MRTPNTSCLLCGKPLYRRPYEMARFRYAACMDCRSEAQKVSGITDKQYAGLRLGRPKGTNHRAGYKHREESKRKIAVANAAFYAAHPELALARGAKTRGALHVNWKGGVAKINESVRRMHENRKWMDAIKERDGACVRCGSDDRLESHHEPPLGDLIATLGIKCREDARRHGAILWDLNGGFALCEPCHYAEHGRTLRAD
jgi:hypothetical protein